MEVGRAHGWERGRVRTACEPVRSLRVIVQEERGRELVRLCGRVATWRIKAFYVSFHFRFGCHVSYGFYMVTTLELFLPEV